MKIISVDDEQGCLDAFRIICQELPNVEYIAGFDNPEAALEHLRSHPVDIAFLDIEMPVMSGLEMAKRIKYIQPKTAVVFVTAYEQYAVQAFAVDASGYILKPYEKSEIAQKILDICGGSIQEPKTVSIHTFYGFELFVNGQRIHFSSAKARELLAILVDLRGKVLTTQQAARMLWPDRECDNKTKALYRMAVSSLKKVFTEAGISEALIDQWGSKGLRTSRIHCDFWTLLEEGVSGKDFDPNSYLPMYEWAQPTRKILEDIKNGKKPLAKSPQISSFW